MKLTQYISFRMRTVLYLLGTFEITMDDLILMKIVHA